jgi:two-component system sensor histidine kinase SenX3
MNVSQRIGELNCDCSRAAYTRSVMTGVHTEAVAPADAGSLQLALAAREIVLSAMSEGVLLVDPSGRIIYTNRAAHMILGRVFENADEVAPEQLRDAIRTVRAQLEEPGIADATIRQIETRGAVVEVTTRPSNPRGTVVVVLRDITRAGRIEDLRRDFVANASHELKTPVASILALSATLRSVAREDPDKLTAFLSRLENEAERLAALVTHLLELSRLEASTPERAGVRLDQLVETEVDRVRSRAESAGLLVSAEVAGPIVVLGSERDLAHLIQNLLENAVRYTPHGGQVHASARRSGADAHLTVTDTGIGIPAKDLDRVFERFYRVDDARSRETGGTGLGLSIVRHVAEAHGGSVRVRSTPGAGSAFTVSLPLGS